MKKNKEPFLLNGIKWSENAYLWTVLKNLGRKGNSLIASGAYLDKLFLTSKLFLSFSLYFSPLWNFMCNYDMQDIKNTRVFSANKFIKIPLDSLMS